MWHIRGASWESQSWDEADPWTANNYIKSEMGISDDEDERWDACYGIATTDSVSPEAYQGGLLTTDPLAANIIGSPYRSQLVQQLTTMGYPAASMSLDDDTAECTSDAKMEALAIEFEGMISSGDNQEIHPGELTCEALGLARIPRGPKWTPPIAPATAPRWTPSTPTPPCPPPAPAWTPGAWPAAPAWRCSSTPTSGGGTNCICSRERWWGRYETKTNWCGNPVIRWRWVRQRETCTDVGTTACPPAGPPAAGCNQSFKCWY